MSLKENKMGVMPVGRLLLGMALPMALSMLVQALYNVVDSMFVSRISDLNNDALNAVSLAFPVPNILIGIATGVAVGVNALLSRGLGEKNMKEVNSSALNGLFLAMCGSLLCMLFGIFGAEPYMRSLTQVEATIQYGIQYIRVICIVSFGIFGEVLFERLLQSTGRTAYTLVTQGTGAIINIILDPILIFGLLGAPKLGVAGAAIATVFGQTFAALLGVYLNIKKNTELKISMKGFRPDLHIIKEIYQIGVPSIIMQAVGSVMVFFLNLILGAFSSTAVATFGAYFKLQSFIFMPVFGLNNGVVPIVAYNYGARKKDRLMEASRLSTRYAVMIMTVGMLLFWVIPNVFLGIFDASDKMLAIGIPALRIISVGFPLAGYAIMKGSVFQALGKSIYSMNISIIRQLLVLLPAAFLLSRLGEVTYVWLAFPIAEIVGLTFSIIYSRKIHREMIDVL